MRIANVGTADRLIRLLIGAGLFALPFGTDIEPSAPSGVALIAIGAILVVTAVVKFCPIYGIFGWRTRPKN